MSGAPAAAPALAALLSRVIDFAGLFPPAHLSMDAAVRAYAAQRAGAHAWMLGRFVVPAARLEEFEEEGAGVLPSSASTSWALSVLVGADVELDVGSIHRFNDRHRVTGNGAVHVDTVELRAATPETIAAAAEFVGAFDAFVEVPLTPGLDGLLAAIADIGAKAKIRTGGVTPDLIPAATNVVRFMRRCLDRGVAFKATAGLHHPLRAEYPLTYEARAPRGVMFGFLNVLLAGAFMRWGMDEAGALSLLEERDASTLEVADGYVRWRGHGLSAEELHRARQDVVSFGSCSFSEPVADLQAMGLL